MSNGHHFFSHMIICCKKHTCFLLQSLFYALTAVFTDQPLFYIFVKNAYAFKDDDCICRMCEARFRKSLEMSQDTEATSSKWKFYSLCKGLVVCLHAPVGSLTLVAYFRKGGECIQVRISERLFQFIPTVCKMDRTAWQPLISQSTFSILHILLSVTKQYAFLEKNCAVLLKHFKGDLYLDISNIQYFFQRHERKQFTIFP
jgi:hypothetical protein